jgi:hypothetical protein
VALIECLHSIEAHHQKFYLSKVDVLFLKEKLQPGTGYSQGRHPEDRGSKPAQDNSL